MASNEDPQTQTLGTSVKYVTITIPSLSGNGTLLSNLIISGTDQSTAAAVVSGSFESVFAVQIAGHTAGYTYGGGTSTGALGVAVAVKENVSVPAQNAWLLTYVKNSANATQTATAVCLLK